MVRALCQPHAYTFNEQSKMATTLTPQTDVTSEKVTWLMENPRQQSRAAYRKQKLIKNEHKHLSFFILSQTSDLFVSHFDGHFAYLKTLDFSFTNWNMKIHQNRPDVWAMISLVSARLHFQWTEWEMLLSQLCCEHSDKTASKCLNLCYICPTYNTI